VVISSQEKIQIGLQSIRLILNLPKRVGSKLEWNNQAENAFVQNVKMNANQSTKRNTMSENEKVTESDLMNMKFHEIIEVHQVPYFRVMKVTTGWLYNFYDSVTDDYKTDWIFVPIRN
jgi:hypothetical protein